MLIALSRCQPEQVIKDPMGETASVVDVRDGWVRLRYHHKSQSEDYVDDSGQTLKVSGRRNVTVDVSPDMVVDLLEDETNRRDDRQTGEDEMAKTKTNAKAKTKAKTEVKAKAKDKDKAEAKVKAEAKNGKMSALDAAVKVLSTAKEPMNCKELVDAMSQRKLWVSANGKTPHLTLSSAIQRDIKKGKESRFKKAGRGKFAVK